jgi:hypothetical protein
MRRDVSVMALIGEDVMGKEMLEAMEVKRGPRDSSAELAVDPSAAVAATAPSRLTFRTSSGWIMDVQTWPRISL